MSDLPAVLGGVPAFPDGPPSWPCPGEAVARALAAAAADGSWGRYNGHHSEALVEYLSVWAGVERVELCASGTAASELALRAFKVGPGDEVVLCAYDYAASFKNVLMLGAVPVLVDADPITCTPVLNQLEDALTDKTAAIVVSHLHGGVVDMPAVMAIANRRGIPVLEDACQATGGSIGSERLGSFGTLGIVSFGGSKLVTSGRGGAILGSDEQLFQRMHLHSFRGNTAYPLSELQAAVLLPQFEQLSDRHAHRLSSAERLVRGIQGLDGLEAVPIEREGVSPALYKLGLRLEPDCGVDRDQFADAARADGIACDRTLHALHKVHSKRRYRALGDLSGAELVHDFGLQLHHPILLSERDDIDRITSAFERILKALRK